MNTIKVLLFPYGSDEPIVADIDNNKSNLIQIIEGKFDDIPLPYNYVLLIGRNNQEDFKYQEEYNVYGNFIISKHNCNNLISLLNSDIEFIKNNTNFLINGPYSEDIKPDIDSYITNMSIIDDDNS